MFPYTVAFVDVYDDVLAPLKARLVDVSVEELVVPPSYTPSPDVLVSP
jgi:hypothetical protein